MEAVKEISTTQIDSETTPMLGSKPLTAAFNRQALLFEQGRFAWMTILITIQSCLGSVAAMFILYGKADAMILSTCAAITMGSNAAFIAQVGPKWSLGIFYLSIVLNTAFILLYAPFGF